jgi:hypothetical protein
LAMPTLVRIQPPPPGCFDRPFFLKNQQLTS